MDHRRAVRTLAHVVATALLLASVAGCSRGANTIVDVDAGSKEDTTTLTPLERGEERRAALDTTRAWVAGWMDSDPDAMRAVAATSVVDPFVETWEEYAAQGHHVEHVREQVYLDVVDMNRDGSEALVTYRYNDDSFVADKDGRKVKSLTPFDDKEIQLTLDKVDGAWRIVRIIAADNAYR